MHLDLSARESISFLAGISLFVAQGVLFYLGFPISVDFLGASLLLAGLPFMFRRDEARRKDDEQ